MKKSIIITPEQCKAARCLLRWGQLDLSSRSNVGINTVTDFERRKRDNIGLRTMNKIVEAFTKEGIVFSNSDNQVTVAHNFSEK